MRAVGARAGVQSAQLNGKQKDFTLAHMFDAEHVEGVMPESALPPQRYGGRIA
jgi:hypothetical protein